MEEVDDALHMSFQCTGGVLEQPHAPDSKESYCKEEPSTCDNP